MNDNNNKIVCPNCGAEQPIALECKNCGIIFSRYKGHQKKNISRNKTNDDPFKQPIQKSSKILRYAIGILILLVAIILGLGGIFNNGFIGFLIFSFFLIMGLYFPVSSRETITINRYHLELSITILILMTLRISFPSAFKLNEFKKLIKKEKIVLSPQQKYQDQCRHTLAIIKKTIATKQFSLLEHKIPDFCAKTDALFANLPTNVKIKLYSIQKKIKILKNTALNGKKWSTKKQKLFETHLRKLENEIFQRK